MLICTWKHISTWIGRSIQTGNNRLERLHRRLSSILTLVFYVPLCLLCAVTCMYNVTCDTQERDELLTTMAAVEKERDFYFDKLRDVELLFQASGKRGSLFFSSRLILVFCPATSMPPLPCELG